MSWPARTLAIQEISKALADLVGVIWSAPSDDRPAMIHKSAVAMFDQLAGTYHAAVDERQERRRLLVQLTAGILANPDRLLVARLMHIMTKDKKGSSRGSEELVALAYLRDIETLLDETPAAALAEPAPRGSVVLVLVFWRETVRSGLVNDRLDQVIVCDSWDQARLVERAYKRADRHITVEEKAVQDFLSERGGRNV